MVHGARKILKSGEEIRLGRVAGITCLGPDGKVSETETTHQFFFLLQLYLPVAEKVGAGV